MSENMKAWLRECKTGEEVQAWFRKMADQFRQEGATHFRFSHYPDDPLWIQIEGYLEQPSGDEPLQWPFVEGAPQ